MQQKPQYHRPPPPLPPQPNNATATAEQRQRKRVCQMAMRTPRKAVLLSSPVSKLYQRATGQQQHVFLAVNSLLHLCPPPLRTRTEETKGKNNGRQKGRTGGGGRSSMHCAPMGGDNGFIFLSFALYIHNPQNEKAIYREKRERMTKKRRNARAKKSKKSGQK